MAELAKNYHNDLQNQHIRPQTNTERQNEIATTLDTIPTSQQLEDPERLPMNKTTMPIQVTKALKLTKNNSATGMDGCPYELWKTLNQHHLERSQLNKTSFNIIKMLTTVFRDIQTHRVEEGTPFALG